jgi:hypothetical protein
MWSSSTHADWGFGMAEGFERRAMTCQQLARHFLLLKELMISILLDARSFGRGVFLRFG